MKVKLAIFVLMHVALFVSSTLVKAQQSEWSLPTRNLRFEPRDVTLSATVQSELDTLTIRMQASPDFKVVIEACCGYSKPDKQLSWDRVQTIINYMTKQKDIDRSRFIFKYHGAPLDNTVRFRRPFYWEEGPSYLQPPYPKLSKISTVELKIKQ